MIITFLRYLKGGLHNIFMTNIPNRYLLSSASQKCEAHLCLFWIFKFNVVDEMKYCLTLLPNCKVYYFELNKINVKYR